MHLIAEYMSIFFSEWKAEVRHLFAHHYLYVSIRQPVFLWDLIRLEEPAVHFDIMIWKNSELNLFEIMWIIELINTATHCLLFAPALLLYSFPLQI